MTLKDYLKRTDMKKLFTSLALIAAIFVVSFTANKKPLPIGAELPNPELKMKDISGGMISFKDAFGKKGLLVMFSCNTCPFVIRNQERTKEICAFASKNNIGVILLNSNEASRDGSESLAAMQQYAKAQSYNWYYAVDENSAMADAFDANRTPECFLFDAAKKLVYHGAIDDNPTDASNVKRQHLQMAISEMAGGKEVSVKESRSVGCAIKRKGD